MRWATMAIRIQREVGGNLAETLRHDRRDACGSARACDGMSGGSGQEGRLSAYVLVAPAGRGPAVLDVEQLRVRQPAWWTSAARGSSCASCGLVWRWPSGIFWMRNVVRIEV